MTDDKPEKSSVCIVKEELRGVDHWTKTYIEVKDDTSEAAYQTYLKLKDEKK